MVQLGNPKSSVETAEYYQSKENAFNELISAPISDAKNAKQAFIDLYRHVTGREVKVTKSIVHHRERLTSS